MKREILSVEKRLEIALRALEMIGQFGIGWSQYAKDGKFLTDGEIARTATKAIREGGPKWYEGGRV